MIVCTWTASRVGGPIAFAFALLICWNNCCYLRTPSVQSAQLMCVICHACQIASKILELKSTSFHVSLCIHAYVPQKLEAAQSAALPPFIFQCLCPLFLLSQAHSLVAPLQRLEALEVAVQQAQQDADDAFQYFSGGSL